MFFFVFSLLASVVGGISGFQHHGLYLNFHVSINNPFAGVIDFWPFVIILIALLLSILWYQGIKNFKKKKSIQNARSGGNRNSLMMLSIVSLFAIALVLSPYYVEHKLSNSSEDSSGISNENRVELLLTVHGMDCGGCEALINRKVGSLEGVEQVIASNLREETFVVYDNSKLTEDEIIQAIEESGYTVVLN